MTIGVGGSTAEAELAAITSIRDAVPPIGAEEIARRVAAARALMDAQGIEAMWLDGTTNLAYFTGLRHGQSERMVGAILPRRGEITVICPAFEAERIKAMQPIPAPVRGWEEDEDPFALLIGTLREMQITSGGIAIDDHAQFFTAHGIQRAGGPDYRYGRSAPIASFLRQRKSGHEIALIEQAMKATLMIQERAARILCEGIATTEVQAFIDAAHRKAGFDGGCAFNIVLFGEASAYPHGVPHAQTLKAGDMVLIDCGASLHGYRSDITRAYVFGEPTDRQRFLWNTVKAAQAAGFAAARPGVPCGALDDAARAVIVAAGFGPGYATPGLPHRVGHGVGMDGHEEPYFVKGNALPLDVGMCGSIEPTLAVYGECGIRLEDHIHVTEKGAAWFTEPTRSVEDPFGLEAGA
jgi:Xaa-Pro dipeptidase